MVGAGGGVGVEGLVAFAVLSFVACVLSALFLLFFLLVSLFFDR